MVKILKEISPEYSLEGLTLKLKLQYFAHLMWRSDLLEKSGEDWRQEKRTAGDEMVGWHHWHEGHEFEHALGIGEGQGSLACCSSRGLKESDATEWLNLSSKESACQCGRHGFDPSSGKIPHAVGQLSPCATTIWAWALEPRSCNYWSRSTLEPELCLKRSQCNEKPTHHNERVDSACCDKRKAHTAMKTQQSQK